MNASKLTAAAAWAALALGLVLVTLQLTAPAPPADTGYDSGDAPQVQSLYGGGQPNRAQNIRGIAINAVTGYSALDVNQDSTGSQLTLSDAGTPVFDAPDGLPLKFPAAAAASIALTTPFAPVRMIQPITAAGTAAPPITIPAAGSIVCVYNSGTAVITIADSGNQVLSAAADLGQYDFLCGFSDGTRFIEFARSNN